MFFKEATFRNTTDIELRAGVAWLPVVSFTDKH
jgi:hypothetical protein